MDIGGMRHPVTLLTFQQTQNPVTGEITESWQELAMVWGNIQSVSGSEFMAASSEQAKTNYKIEIYHRYDLAPNMRLESAGTTYEVKAILPNNDRSLATLMCEVLI
jgi:SPP1 family predicted phage head-tail adaptor